jgi:DnaJ-class molecular chaperone
MTCIVCNGKGYYTTVDYTPQGTEYYREVCRLCHPEVGLQPAELIRVEGERGYMEDRETRIASGAEGWTPGGEI